MKQFWLVWGMPLAHLAIGIGAGQVLVRISRGWPFGWRFAFIMAGVLAIAVLFIATNRWRDRRLVARREGDIDQLLTSLGAAGSATLIQGGIKVRNGQSKAEVMQWLAGIGVPEGIREDIYRRVEATARPPFLQPVARRTFADRAWPVLLLLGIAAVVFGFLVSSKPCMIAGFVGWLGAQELAERAWIRAGRP